MSVTLVSCFFDINREKNGDGRTIEEYLEWIKKTLQLNAKLFIVTEPKFESFFKEHMHINTILKIINFKDLHYYKYYDQISNILQLESYKSRIRHPDRIECKLPEYNIIQYSKFHILQMAINENPFSSDFFFWIDAGISRFFLNVDITKDYPSYKSIDFFQYINDKFIIQSRNDLEYYNIDENFIWDSSNLLVGTMFGGSSQVISKVSDKVEEVFQQMIEKDNVNNEQLALSIVWKKYPELFFPVKNTTNQHLIIFKSFSE